MKFSIVIKSTLLSIVMMATSFAAINTTKKINSSSSAGLNPKQHHLMEQFRVVYKDNKMLKKIKKETLDMSGKAIPVLIKVMKGATFPDKNRWVATFLLGQVAGVKASPFIVKFTQHKNWVLRLASLKTLLALKEKRYAGFIAKNLKDKSMLVRVQALENIRQLKLKPLASSVWSMLYDQENYTQGKTKKRTNIIKSAIHVVGDLGFQKAKKPLLSMIQKRKYEDIFEDIDYSLKKITGKESPAGTREVKKHFWRNYSMREKTI